MRTEDIRAGDVLQFWHDTGAFGHNLHYAKVLYMTPNHRFRVVDEYGRRSLKNASFFHAKVSEEDVTALFALKAFRSR